jgi:hypothetical protein
VAEAAYTHFGQICLVVIAGCCRSTWLPMRFDTIPSRPSLRALANTSAPSAKPWMTSVLEELARIQSHDVVLPTAAHGQIRLRCVAQPDAAQAALLDRLGIVLPKRMRLSENNSPLPAISA